MKKLKLVVLALAIALIPRLSHAADAGYFSKFVAPGQSYFFPSATETAIGTSPYHNDGVSQAGFSTTPIHGPIVIMSSNTQRIGWWIMNISTRIYNNPLGDVRIYVGTSPVTTGWSTSTVNQGQEDLRFSSNAFPVPLATTWVLSPYSTTTVIELNGFNDTAIGAGAGFASVVSSSPLTNLGYTGLFDVPGFISRNVMYQTPAGLNTYVGDLYAVAVGTFGSSAANLPGRVRAIQQFP